MRYGVLRGRRPPRLFLILGLAALVLLGGAGTGVALIGGGTDGGAAGLGRELRAASPKPLPTTTTSTAPTTTSTTAPAPPPAPASVAADPGPPTDLPLPGCPPPPYTGPPPTPPWHPAHLVPDSQLPAAPAPPPGGRNALTAIAGKGMWIWQPASTDGGDVNATVADAVKAGLHQLWVRVGDSENGFYGADYLSRLVPAAHAAGVAVVGWGFPYLFDPEGDARWTDAVIGWHTADGQHLDGYSADIETSSEGVALSPPRVAVYLGLVRRWAPKELLVATVFPPTDSNLVTYPYSTMAPYIDAYAPMVYWGCLQPVTAARQAMTRLQPLAPVHVIGQAYDMGPYGGRVGAPAADELDAFMAAARQGGALGASFWSWQAMNGPEWAALRQFKW
ncbi:MAG TPA: hypothetical protein VGR90_09865 [Acidimicrobiales bacterium]|nr:hypothetical protein [Acidimicrobiales bacterium]